MTDDSGMGGRLAAGPWWLLYSGSIEPNGEHAHRAAQVVVHGGVPCVSVDGRVRNGPIVVVPPGSAHAVRDHRDHALVLVLSPGSVVGEILADHHDVPEGSLDGAHPVARILGSLRMSNWSHADEAVRRILEQFDGVPPADPLGWWHPRALDDALLGLPDGVVPGDVDFERLADDAGLPTARVASALTDRLGIALGSYVHWLRLVRAIAALADGADLQSAATAARFARAADLSSAVRSMFGMEPTELVRLGRWLVAP